MSAELLKKAFDPFFEAPLEAWNDFADKCETIHVEKDCVLKLAGKKERYLYFIIQGSVGVFLWKENNFVCLDFAFENHFVGDYMSILTGRSTPLQITALEKSSLMRISREKYMQLGESEIGKTLMKVAAESTFIAKQQQQIDLLTKTAEQRYRELLEHQPMVIQRVAQKHLASYLGITPQSLSRIRKKIIS